ncbi:hypothetical protein NC651_018192 [Populus alba x Populus x berolinensis]|nr:hypothetical protein NC651_018192 [Populus alba x Populus x berolinensis]
MMKFIRQPSMKFKCQCSCPWQIWMAFHHGAFFTKSDTCMLQVEKLLGLLFNYTILGFAVGMMKLQAAPDVGIVVPQSLVDGYGLCLV